MQVKRQMESEVFPSEVEGGPSRYFRQLSANEQEALLMARLKKYCQKVYKRVLDKVRPVTLTPAHVDSNLTGCTTPTTLCSETGRVWLRDDHHWSSIRPAAGSDVPLIEQLLPFC